MCYPFVKDFSKETFLGILLGLLFLLTISVIVFVFGETEKGCVAYKSNNLIIIGGDNKVGQCYWLVDKLLYNGSGFHISGYVYQPGGGVVSNNDFTTTEKFVMSK